MISLNPNPGHQSPHPDSKLPYSTCLHLSSSSPPPHISHSWALCMMGLMCSSPGFRPRPGFYRQHLKVHGLAWEAADACTHSRECALLTQNRSRNLSVMGSVLFNRFRSSFRFLSLTFGRSSPSGCDKSGHFRERRVCLCFVLLGLCLWLLFHCVFCDLCCLDGWRCVCLALPSLYEWQHCAVNKWFSLSLLPVLFPSLWQRQEWCQRCCQPKTVAWTVNTQTASRKHTQGHICVQCTLSIKYCKVGCKRWRTKETICIANEATKEK